MRFIIPINRHRKSDETFYIPGEDFKKDGLNRHQQLDWVEENFDAASQKQFGGQLGNKSQYLGLLLSQPKLMGVLFFTFIALLILFGRTAYIQAFKGDYYHQQAEGNRIRLKYLKSPRGIIYGRNFEPLVKNIPSFSLYLSPVDLPHEEEARNQVLAEVAKITDLNLDEIKEKLDESSPYYFQQITIKEDIDYLDALRLEIESERLPGVNLETVTKRQYLSEASSLSHLLGYEGKITEEELANHPDYFIDDRLGKTGLEYSYEDVLRGQYGREEIEVDALGKKKKLLAQEAEQPGHSLVLTIDPELQNEAEKVLKQVLAANHKERGSVIAMDPNTGEILAMVSWPAFDNNLFSQGIKPEDYQKYLSDTNRPLFNRSITGEYPSGSTFKPIVAAAALEEGIINAHTSFYSVGGIQIDKWFFPDWKAGGHGWTDVIKALAESVNTFFYYIGGGDNDKMDYLGVNKIVEYAKKFGLSTETGIDLPGERPGFLPTMKWKEVTKGEPWYIGDTYHLAIGQGDILVTPLQVASYTATFANGGTYYQPYLVKEIIDADGKTVQDIQPKVLNSDFIDPQNIAIVNQGLRRAVTDGSARALSDLPFKVAGKTGTAEWNSQKSPHAWFTGFAPYDNPEISITVLVEEGGEGSAVALPVAKEILRWWFTQK